MNTRRVIWAALMALAALMATGCTDDGDSDPTPAMLAEDIFAPLGQPAPFATAEQLESFERGLAVAEHRFTPEQGLGPTFNVTFCASCHEKPVFGGSGPRYRNFLLVAADLEDGSHVPLGKNGVQTQYDLESGRTPTDEDVNILATRNAIPFFGTGVIAELSEESILANADPDDLDGDGISGRPNFDRGFVGRFGRKAQTVSIEGFIRGPLFNHLGITTNPLSNEKKAQLPVPSGLTDDQLEELNQVGGGLAQLHGAQAAAPGEPTTDDDGIADPEMSEQELFDLISFAMLLAAPQPDVLDEQALLGEQLFESTQCASCHAPTLEGPRGLVPLYSDLLLHDMGSELADGIVMGLAAGSEFRTQPLWGITATGPYLHDGRADTLHDAVVWHGGEAEGSREAYLALSDSDRAALLHFLDSLGGRDQASTGLLAPDAPIPAAGEYGGPQTELSDGEAMLFEQGREVFDRDRFVAEGLGPKFNGDACRSCHFEPTIGGAGPLGVNVIRQVITTADGVELPGMGTMAHRFDVSNTERPPIDPDANFFEWRQTPSAFGIGLIDTIAEETFAALADPEDADGDGISGRVHVLADGRYGRFGWKGDVPSVEEFMRDALSNENGLTLPDREGLTFGHATDDDAIEDPEMPDDEYEALNFYLTTLAAPERNRVELDAEDNGELVFETIGCAGCHTPSLPAEDGTPIELYSDLLLHEMLPVGTPGVPSGDASAIEFRTPPLWGISTTGPYMHDGRATTLADSIAAHDGEAAQSRDSFLALDAADQEALMAFLNSL